MTDLPSSRHDHFSTQIMTPEKAEDGMLCPMTLATSPSNCIGRHCGAWRFLPLEAADPAFMSAVQAEITNILAEREAAGSKTSRELAHGDAVKRVMRDPSEYSIPHHYDRGYCGVGGRP